MRIKGRQYDFVIHRDLYATVIKMLQGYFFLTAIMYINKQFDHFKVIRMSMSYYTALLSMQG